MQKGLAEAAAVAPTMGKSWNLSHSSHLPPRTLFCKMKGFPSHVKCVCVFGWGDDFFFLKMKSNKYSMLRDFSQRFKCLGLNKRIP